MRPAVLAPVFLAATVTLLIVAPYRAGDLTPAALASGGLSGPIGELLVAWAGLVALLVLVGCAAVVLVRPSTRRVVLVVCLVGFFGTGFQLTRLSLTRHLAVQRGELILYPWRAFQEELDIGRPDRVAASRRVIRNFRMLGQRITRDRIARLFFKRPRLRVRQRDDLSPEIEYSVGTRRDLARWRQQLPRLGRTAVFDASGQLVLIQPTAAKLGQSSQ